MEDLINTDTTSNQREILSEYLYVEEQIGSIPQGTFTSRYFVLFPFCGLKWFAQKKYDLNYAQCINDTYAKDINDHQINEEGWIFGGNIRVTYFKYEDSISSKDRISTSTLDKFNSELQVGDLLYPFIIKIQRGDDIEMCIRLATTSYEKQQNWINNINNIKNDLRFIQSCCSFNALPSRRVLNSSNIHELNTFHSDCIDISIATLYSINSYLKFLYPLKSVLNTLILKNSQLSDDHIEPLSQLLLENKSLKVFSISENFISCKGIIGLFNSLSNCTQMKELDFASNCISDVGAEAITKIILSLPDLEKLNLSKNLITNKASRPMIQTLGRYCSKITHINMSYNRMGDGIAALVTLLMFNKPSLITHCDLSYCDITDRGVQDLSEAIISCDSIKFINLQGSFVNADTLIKLTTTLAEHEKSNSKRKNQVNSLAVEIGGILLDKMEDQSLISLSYNSIKSSLPFVDDEFLLHKIVLHRRDSHNKNPIINNSSNKKSFAASAEAAAFNATVKGITVCMQLQLPKRIKSIQEVLRLLANSLDISFRRFKLLSFSPSSENINETMKSNLNIVFLIKDQIISSPSKLNTNKIFSYKVASRMSVQQQLQIFSNNLTKIDISNVEIIKKIKKFAEESSPIFRLIGLRSIFVQDKSLTLNSRIISSNSGGRGLEDDFVDSLSPNSYIQDSFDNLFEDINDDEGININNSFNKISDLMDSLKVDERNNDENISEEKKRNYSISNSISNRKSKIINQRFSHSVRQLKKSDTITNSTAKFWEGAFGNSRYKKYMNKILDTCLNDEGIYKAVGFRQSLCDSMFQRDTKLLQETLKKVKENQIDGHHAVIYSERILSDLLCIQNDAKNLELLTNSYDDLIIVEKFLINCAESSYSGPEMYKAIELRQNIILTAIQDEPEKYREILSIIKQKAYLTNVLLSRDFDKLKSSINCLPDNIAFSLQELVSISKNLIYVQNKVNDDLKESISERNLLKLEEIIAVASYHNIYNNLVQQGFNLIIELSISPINLLIPIVKAVKDKNLDLINEGLLVARRNGLKHLAIDAAIAQNIIDSNEKLIQEELIKNNLIKIALSIKNGATVSSSEIMQLLRRSKLMNLIKDPSYKVYINILEKQRRKFSWLAKQEDQIQAQIDNSDVENLEILLAGRGTGRIVINAPTYDLLCEWMKHLEDVCKGRFNNNNPIYDIYNFNPDHLIMAGTMEKAARRSDGVLRGWRQRYFTLRSNSLTYYTKLDGIKKGFIRVLGGSIRQLSIAESGGRPFCIELQEGKDLSIFNPDLLDDARKVVRQVRCAEISNSIRICIDNNDRYNLVKLLDLIQIKGIYLDLNLISEARNVVDKDNVKKLKYDLRKSLVTIPRGLIGELLRKATLLNLDPKISLLSQAKRLLELTDIEQNILRIRGSIEANNESNFSQAFAHLARLESKQLNLRDHRLLVAILLQNTGKRALHSRYLGVSKSVIICSLKYSLSCIQQFNLETEPIQLSRLVIRHMSVHSSNTSNVSTNIDIHLDKSLRFSKYLDENKNLLELNPEYAIESYSALNSPFVLKDTFLSSLRGEAKITIQEFLSYSKYPISKSLLNLPKTDQQLCIDSFAVLMVVLKHSNTIIAKKNLIGNKNDDINTLAYKIIKSGQSLSNSDNYRDELYLQLCKQLTNNPDIITSIRGWLLLSLYLHAFKPSITLLPYIRNFVTKSLKITDGNVKKSLIEVKSDLQKAQNDKKTEEKIPANSLMEQMLVEKIIKNSKDLYQIVFYCDWLSSNIIIKHKHRAEKNSDDSTVTGSSVNDSTLNDEDEEDDLEDVNISTDIIDNVFNQNSVEFKVTIMTGAVYSMNCKYGEITTPHSLLPLIYNRMTNENESDKNKLFKIFRGFSFYKNDTFDNEYEDNNINSISIQPSDNKLLDWNYDLIWKLLLLKLKLKDINNSNVNNKNVSNDIADHIIDDDLVMVDKIDTDIQQLILRRRVAMKSERFIDQLDLFNDHVSDVDILGVKKLWSTFLLSDSLPSDYVRLDLLFAEESRYVNSGLYAGSDSMQMYLLAIQIALSYSSTNDKSNWINCNNSDNVLNNSNYSVYSINQRQNKKNIKIEETKNDSSTIQTEDKEESTEIKSVSSEEEDDDDDNDDDDKRSVASSDTNLSSSLNENISEESSEEEEGDDDTAEHLHIVTIEEKIELLGLNHILQDHKLLSIIKDLVPQFLEISKDICVDSPQIRYLLKRAYLHYLMSWPLYGTRFFEAKLSDNYISKTSKVLISLSTNGILILDPNGWCVIFECKLDDVDFFNVSHDNKNKKILLIKINGMELKLKCEASLEIINLVEAFSLEILGNGSFQLGSEGCSDPFDFGPEPPMKSDSKEILQQYYRDFPNLPNSPAISALYQSGDYFEAPTSARDLLAEARLQEERMEIEQSRLAAAIQVERQQAMMEQGRKNVMQFENSNDDDDDDEEIEKEVKSTKRLSKRRNRSTIGVSMISPSEMLVHRISSSAAGVSGRKSTRAVLPPPIIRSKLLKIHNIERREITNNPDLSLINLPNPNNLSPVSLKWQSK